MYRKWGEYRTKVTEDPHHSLCGCMAKASSNTQASTFVCIRHTLTPKRGGAAARRRSYTARGTTETCSASFTIISANNNWVRPPLYRK